MTHDAIQETAATVTKGVPRATRRREARDEQKGIPPSCVGQGGPILCRSEADKRRSLVLLGAVLGLAGAAGVRF